MAIASTVMAAQTAASESAAAVKVVAVAAEREMAAAVKAAASIIAAPWFGHLPANQGAAVARVSGKTMSVECSAGFSPTLSAIKGAVRKAARTPMALATSRGWSLAAR